MPSLLDSWRVWLEQQQEKVSHNASQILRGMVIIGFTGSETTVKGAITKWRKGVKEPLLLRFVFPLPQESAAG